MTEMLDDLVESRAKPEDRDLILELCEHMRTGSICGLGKNAATPLLSLLKLFADDFDAHLRQPAPRVGAVLLTGGPALRLPRTAGPPPPRNS